MSWEVNDVMVRMEAADSAFISGKFEYSRLDNDHAMFEISFDFNPAWIHSQSYTM